jgi:anion-transporting  ArsA/GET3 family ATPase
VRPPPAPLAERLDGKRVVICAGPGGVGKTTTSAALALGLARRGQRVAVLTIDPAQRLAAALGLDEREDDPPGAGEAGGERRDPGVSEERGGRRDPGANEARGKRRDPGAHHPVSPALLAAHGIDLPPGGELWAMTLDVKGTFDGLIARLAPSTQAAEEVLSNRIYQELSSAVAGSQEFTAIAKLFELERSGEFDVVVLDTPPSRNALDFLDAPSRLTQFFDGRALKVFLAPTGVAARWLGRGTGLVLGMFTRVTGIDLMGDMTVFFRSLGSITEGFTERARGIEALLRDPATTFLLVTSPESEPVGEALFLAGRLSEAGMARGGLIVNRAHLEGLHGHSPAAVQALLEPELGERLAARVASNLADFDVLAVRDRESIARLSAELGEPAPVVVPYLDGEVDLDGLVEIERRLFA